MKNLISTSLLAFLLLGPAPVSAQFGGFGLRGGVNLTKFVGGDAGAAESKQGLRVGGAISLLSLGPVSITPEIYYAQKGSRQLESVEGAPMPVQLDLSLDYIEVPVLAKLSIPFGQGVGRHLRPYLAAGPAYAWKIGCEVRVVESDEALPDCGEVLGRAFSSARTAVRSADKGIVLNGGIDLNVLGMGVVNLDARLVRGLDRLGEGEDGPNVRNQAFSLMLGYSFGVGGWR
jgi:hypothetical protein